MVGKWHLGHASAGDLPQNRGFDSFYGFYEAQLDYSSNRFYGITGKGGNMWHAFRDQDGPVDKSGKYMTNDLTDEALRKLRGTFSFKQPAVEDQPRYIYLPYQAPHAPVTAPNNVKDWLK